MPFAKKGRYGVVAGSVAEHFHPHHLLVETGNVADINEQDLVTRVTQILHCCQNKSRNSSLRQQLVWLTAIIIVEFILSYLAVFLMCIS